MPPHRLNRLFDAASGRALHVAIDHGAPGEAAMLGGIEDIEGAVDRVVAANPDAVLLAPGQAELLQRRLGRAKPSLLLRVDVPNVYGPGVPERAWSVLFEDAVGRAVRLDAAGVVVNLLEAPGHPELREDCVRNLAVLRAACDQAGMPLMVEPLALRPGEGGYGMDGDVDRICGLVRQAVELGADLIKADPTDDPAEYAAVVRVARVPVLARGGGRIDDREILARTEALLAQGAQGVVYGRNVIQHPDPPAMVRALAAVVHGSRPAADAEAELGLGAQPA
jgi:DhnA family fructose-bisphosphate aldolase class Ia